MTQTQTVALIIFTVMLIPSAWTGFSDLMERSALERQVSSLVNVATGAGADGDTESAVVALRSARRLQPANLDVERALLLAECRLSAEKPASLTRSGALSLSVRIKAFGLTAKGSAEVAVAQGQIAVFRGRPEDALSLFEAAAKAHPAASEVLFGLAKARLLNDKAQSAIKPLRAAVKLDPRSFRYRQALGRALSNLEKWGGAVEAFTQAGEISDTPMNRLQLGEALLKIGNHQAAIRALESAKQRLNEPTELARARAALGFAYHKAGKNAESAVELEGSVRIRPDSSVFFNLGMVRHALGQHRLAMIAFQSGLTRRPGNTGAYVELMRSLIALGQKTQARAVRTRLAQLVKTNPKGQGDLQRADRLLGVP
jgi:tetratricopeptide (TPR) repeat protein